MPHQPFCFRGWGTPLPAFSARRVENAFLGESIFVEVPPSLPPFSARRVENVFGGVDCLSRLLPPFSARVVENNFGGGDRFLSRLYPPLFRPEWSNKKMRGESIYAGEEGSSSGDEITSNCHAHVEAGIPLPAQVVTILFLFFSGFIFFVTRKLCGRLPEGAGGGGLEFLGPGLGWMGVLGPD